MEKLRHVTFNPLTEWLSLEELIGMPRRDRVKYVRTNLPNPRERSRTAWMSHDDFAKAVGAPDRAGPIRWEKGATPRDYAANIAALTPYPADAFGAPGEAELVRATFAHRLRLVEDRVRWLRSQMTRISVAVDLDLELELEPQDEQWLAPTGDPLP